MSNSCASLHRSDWVGKEGAARAGEPAEGGDEIIEEAIQEAPEPRSPLCPKKEPNGLQVLGEVLGEDRCERPTGHSGRGAGAGSGSGRP